MYNHLVIKDEEILYFDTTVVICSEDSELLQVIFNELFKMDYLPKLYTRVLTENELFTDSKVKIHKGWAMLFNHITSHSEELGLVDLESKLDACDLLEYFFTERKKFYYNLDEEDARAIIRINGSICGICHLPFYEKCLKNIFIDHIIPRSVGGSCNVDNMQLVHRYCNTSKGSKPPREFEGKRNDVFQKIKDLDTKRIFIRT